MKYTAPRRGRAWRMCQGCCWVKPLIMINLFLGKVSPAYQHESLQSYYSIPNYRNYRCAACITRFLCPGFITVGCLPIWLYWRYLIGDLDKKVKYEVNLAYLCSKWFRSQILTVIRNESASSWAVSFFRRGNFPLSYFIKHLAKGCGFVPFSMQVCVGPVLVCRGLCVCGLPENLNTKSCTYRCPVIQLYIITYEYKACRMHMPDHLSRHMFRIERKTPNLCTYVCRISAWELFSSWWPLKRNPSFFLWCTLGKYSWHKNREPNKRRQNVKDIIYLITQRKIDQPLFPASVLCWYTIDNEQVIGLPV